MTRRAARGSSGRPAASRRAGREPRTGTSILPVALVSRELAAQLSKLAGWFLQHAQDGVAHPRVKNDVFQLVVEGVPDHLSGRDRVGRAVGEQCRDEVPGEFGRDWAAEDVEHGPGANR